MGLGPVQTSYSQNPQEAQLGQIAEGFGPQRVRSRIGRGLIRAGYGVLLAQGAGNDSLQNPQYASIINPGTVYHVPFPAGTVSAAALHTGASSASVQTITSFNGVYGASELMPSRTITFTFDSSTDWDPTTGTVTFVDDLGNTVTENLAVATSAALTTTKKVRKLLSVTLPAQTGAGGVFTIGVSALTTGTEALFAGVAIRQAHKMTIATAGLFGYPGQLGVTGPADYVDSDSVPCLTEGGIWVYSEAAVNDGDPVYMRTAANGGLTVLGAFAPASGTGLTQLTRASFVRKTTGAGPAWARFSYGEK